MNAEDAYLFRHALLRDAAYQLQLPGDRAKLHALAFEVIEAIHGGTPPFPESQPDRLLPHPTDAVAAELAEHAGAALEQGGIPDGQLVLLKRLYLKRAAILAEASYRFDQALILWTAYSNAAAEDERADSLLRVGDACRLTGYARLALEWYGRAFAVSTQRPDFAVNLHAAMAIAHHDLGEPEAAEKHYRLAVEALNEPGVHVRRARLLAGLAMLLRETGRIKEARGTMEQALQLFEAGGDGGSAASAWANYALVLKSCRDRAGCMRYLEKALDAYRSDKNKRGEGIALGNLAVELQETDDFAGAERHYRQATEIHQQVGNRRGEANVLANLAALLRVQGRLDESRATNWQALAALREMGARRTEGIILANLGNREVEIGNVPLARDYFSQALEIARAAKDRVGEGICQGALAGLCIHGGETRSGIQQLLGAIEIHREVGNREYEGVHLCTLATLLLAERRLEEARAAWNEGIAILGKFGSAGTLERRYAPMREACAKAGVPPFD